MRGGSLNLVTSSPTSENLFKQRRAPRLGIKLRDARIKALTRGALFASEVGEDWFEQLHTVRPPRPRAQTTELAFSEIHECRRSAALRPGTFQSRCPHHAGPEAGAPIHLHKLRQREACLLDA